MPDTPCAAPYASVDGDGCVRSDVERGRIMGAATAGLFVFFLVCAGLAFIPASIASRKGRSAGGFWIFGFFFLVPALIVALVINEPDGRGRVACPQCAEKVASGALMCRFCGLQFAGPLLSDPGIEVSDRACQTPGCSEIGRPTHRAFCDVCDMATARLATASGDKPYESAAEVEAEVRSRLLSGVPADQLVKDWRAMNQANLVSDADLDVALATIRAATGGAPVAR